MTDEEKLVARILDVIPPRSLELATFFSLFRVRFSDEVETACVTCGASPELLLNRDFVETHCRTGEHLLMLVMHELYHVVLGHTTLFPHATRLSNIVFDAVINALLCSLFPKPEFTSFFTDYYPADRMPFALLRPKGDGTPAAAENALHLLYEERDSATYYDVFQALLSDAVVAEAADVGSAGDGDGGQPVLLGSHSGNGDDAMSAEMRDLIHEVISKWPSPDRPLAGRDLGAAERKRDFGDGKADAALRRGVRRLMHHAAEPGPTEVRRRAVRETAVESATFLPDWRDRSHEAREAVLGDAILYRTTLAARRPTSRDNRRVFAYFDVSGSVAAEVPSVAAALEPWCRRRLCRVHVFSTTVAPASVRDLAVRRFSSTGGTSIDCVLEHALSLPRARRPRSIVVFTDGYTGRPHPSLAARFRSSGMRLYVGLFGGVAGNSQTAALSSLATRMDPLTA